MINEEEIKKVFGTRLTEARKLCGITQLTLAEKINYSDKAVSKWERGESLPDVFTIMRIADTLGVTMSYLLGEEDKPRTPENSRKNRRSIAVFVPLVSALGIYFIASVLFLIFKQIPSLAEYAEYTFLFALPVVFITLSVFSFIWWNNISQFVCLSLLIWTAYLTVYTAVGLFASLPDFKYIFISCAILQVICIIVFLFVYFRKRSKN
ncbi:MAG: helix-turn-helix domain-containing protein [Acutalibacteraceae bacterium]